MIYIIYNILAYQLHFMIIQIRVFAILISG